MRHRIIQEKNFLRKVHKTKDFKQVERASFDQLKAILTAVHFVINKKVPITKALARTFLQLKKKTIEDLKKTFKSPEDLLKLFKLDRNQVIKIVKKYFDLIKATLGPYFNKKTRPENLLT